MTRHLTVARACLAVAVAELAAAAYLAGHGAAWPAALAACTALSFLLVAVLARRAHHRARAEAQRAEQLARGDTPPTLAPCCSFWQHSDGEVHGPHCARPILPRWDRYRLNPADQQTFEQISRSYDDQDAA